MKPVHIAYLQRKALLSYGCRNSVENHASKARFQQRQPHRLAFSLDPGCQCSPRKRDIMGLGDGSPITHGKSINHKKVTSIWLCDAVWSISCRVSRGLVRCVMRLAAGVVACCFDTMYVCDISGGDEYTPPWAWLWLSVCCIWLKKCPSTCPRGDA